MLLALYLSRALPSSQRHIAEDAGLHCLLARVLTLCLDDACMDLCTQHEIKCDALLCAVLLGAPIPS